MRTRENLSHAGQVTSSALSSVGVVLTRRLAAMRYRQDWPRSSLLISDKKKSNNVPVFILKKIIVSTNQNEQKEFASDRWSCSP